MKLNSAGYFVYFEKDDFNHLNRFLKEHSFSTIFILCDKNTKKHCLPLFLKENTGLKDVNVFSISAGEKYKTLDTALSYWNFLLNNNADKNSLLICLGGGVVCDLGGFIASTFKRGMHFINVPTTLLSMADASVGGKNGIDFNGYKNLIGTITQPKGVFIYEGFLNTLPSRQIKNGFAEIAKAALIGDKKLWKKFLSLSKLPETSLTSFIHDSVSVKNKIVLKDPTEKNIRKILNFGHTAGHAIETHFLHKKSSLLHGEAIVIGMCVELCLGKILTLTAPKIAMEAFLFFKKHYTLQSFSEKEMTVFIELMQHDKKNKNGELNFALIEDIAKPLINISASAQDVKEAFILYNNLQA
ncbi:MAG TPA: 3-dehydroquinate synthase [Bacteroidia bacterium]|nr:3-dehydroquinate synthase [Bacteroidia bacterium]